MIAPQTTFVKAEQNRQGGAYAPKWFVVDAEGMIVGRLATQIATVLMGKHKPEYTPHVDTGDYVIVINADKVRFTGGDMVHKDHEYYTTKMSKKSYQWFTGWPGGQRNIDAHVTHRFNRFICGIALTDSTDVDPHTCFLK